LVDSKDIIGIEGLEGLDFVNNFKVFDCQDPQKAKTEELEKEVGSPHFPLDFLVFVG
jgi:hypothetical protein